MFKFLFDTILAAILLLILSPVILVCVLAIRMSSPGPGIFRQTRVGCNEKLFICYKLRTMAVTTIDLPTHEASASSITPIGHFLRRTKLDEIPQLINVVRGEMSFVGPRPCLPQQTELVNFRRARGALNVRPGITGLAQVRNIDMSDPARLTNVDAEYLQTRNFGLDLRIMLATVFGHGQGDRIVPERSERDPANGRPKP